MNLKLRLEAIGASRFLHIDPHNAFGVKAKGLSWIFV
jgi:hypothetical protein